ncbi:CHAT domain-containing protein [Streptomyces sp. NBC_01443]|uniref:CHAT domain-containing protein n=1 Tax=Streptomyces sp. NBC_01443 TaxID=2903868 RepID=UPI0022561C28|nr:CHAT domain-containing protein [Streptomyces sp. NBC_01443]MCX4632763.1 CHAT domain-containing protein [Streptomyces sp. NBC_01443]
MHPLAQLGFHLRTQVLTDPLHRPVAREAEDSLRFERLFGEIADVLPALRRSGKTHLCFWGHGPFHYLPFSLLHLEGRPLADTWTVTSVPSLSSVRVLRVDAETTGRPRGSGLLTVGAALGGAAWDLPAEPALEEHARAVARAAAGTALTGSEATAKAFIARAPGARYLHIAAHGSLDQAAPSFQCLYLNPPDAGTEGRLFAHEVLTMDLRGVELVTLSACESALGRFDLVDEVRGLTAAFLIAGADAVVGCLWPVRVPVATHFFSALYQAMSREGDARLAFRHTQKSTREAFPQYRDWGTFAYSGAWRPIGERVPKWTS